MTENLAKTIGDYALSAFSDHPIVCLSLAACLAYAMARTLVSEDGEATRYNDGRLLLKWTLGILVCGLIFYVIADSASGK